LGDGLEEERAEGGPGPPEGEAPGVVQERARRRAGSAPRRPHAREARRARRRADPDARRSVRRRTRRAGRRGGALDGGAVPLGRETSWAEAQRLAARKQEHYRRLASEGPALVRGVAEFVAGLAAQRVPRAVATSASRHDVEVLLTLSGLRDRFEVVVAAEDVHRGKPDPEVYLLAAHRLGVAPERC